MARSEREIYDLWSFLLPFFPTCQNGLFGASDGGGE